MLRIISSVLLVIPKRIFPIGRLDKDSEGLIFLTNDGDIVNKILRAGNQHEKEYSVRVHKPIEGAFLKAMSEGVPIMDTRTLPCRIKQTGKQSFTIILTQGLNRQIRRMCEYLGYEVTNLQRTRIMHIRLDKLATGKWRYLSDAEMETLQESVSDSSAAPEKVKVPEIKSRKENRFLKRNLLSVNQKRKGKRNHLTENRIRKGIKKLSTGNLIRKLPATNPSKRTTGKEEKRSQQKKVIKHFVTGERKNNYPKSAGYFIPALALISSNVSIRNKLSACVIMGLSVNPSRKHSCTCLISY